VDLRSNGHRCVRVPWTASCARRTGPRWTGRITRRGTRSGPSTQDLTALDVCTRWAAATTLESGGARRKLAGASPVRRSRPSFRPRVGAICCAGACARGHGVSGNDWASPAASTVRGRRGHSGELGEAMLCAKRRGIGRGILLTTHRG
jgi:hypothetical protein